MRDLLEDAAELVFKITAMLMRFAPIGAFGAMAFTIGKYGLAALGNLAGLVATFYITSLLFVFVVLGLVARVAGFSILELIRYLKAELWLVLGTSSSESALPSLMEKMERAGCAKPIVGLVVPTGYSFNLDGTNIYMTLASLFIAQACGIDLSWEQQALLLGRRDAVVEGRGRGDRRGLHHACRDLVDHPRSAGRRHGADPRRRPLHERMPQPDQFHRQCGGDGGGVGVGRRARPGQAQRRAGRTPALASPRPRPTRARIRGRPPDTAGRSRTAWLFRACRGAGPSSDIRR